LFAFEELTANNYEQKVNNKNVILDFYATWWSACKVLGKNLTKYNTSYNDNVTIYKVDFDTQPELYKKYKVRTVPVVVYLKNNTLNITFFSKFFICFWRTKRHKLWQKNI
jgi:thioredoxin 1